MTASDADRSDDHIFSVSPMTVGVPELGSALLEAKTSVPLLRPGSVRREALVRRLEGARAAEARVVSVVAPAGYGKTTVLAQWSDADLRSFAWLAVDGRDNDPVLLLRYLLAALADAGNRAASAASAAVLEEAVVPEMLLAEVCAALGQSESPTVLVLDDVHELTAVETHDLLGTIVRALPRGSQLVLSGRTELTSVVARPRAAGAVCDVGAGDLALDAAEAEELLAAAGVELAGDAVQDLVESSEGWAAGLYLAALGSRPDSMPPTLGPADLDRFVDDYLRTEYLSSLSGEQLAFLTRSAALDRISAGLCDAVLERRDSARMLEEIERANLFLVPLDRGRAWYRYHAVFRAVLVGELQRRDAGALDELRRRAADWYEANGLSEEAMAYAIACDDVERMARLLVVLGFRLYREHRVATLREWLEHFDDSELLRRFPLVAVVGGLIHALSGRPFHAERWLDAAARNDDVGPLPDGSSRVRAWRATAEAVICRQGPERMREDAELALAELGPLSPFRGPAMLALGYSLLLSGELEAADRQLEAAHEAGVASGATFASVAALALRAMVAVDVDLDLARSLCARTREVVDFERARGYVVLALPLGVEALLAARAGDREAAEHTLAQAQALRPHLNHAIPAYAAHSLLTMARAYLVLGDTQGALAVLLDVSDVLRRRSDLTTLVAEAATVRAAVDETHRSTSSAASSLTIAELRLLPLLTTHLTFREIGERLFVSRNTVKTQAVSIYRKLGVTSRSDAVRCAAEIGLVDSAVSSSAKITP